MREMQREREITYIIRQHAIVSWKKIYIEIFEADHDSITYFVMN